MFQLWSEVAHWPSDLCQQLAKSCCVCASTSDQGNRSRRRLFRSRQSCVNLSIDQFFHRSVYWIGSCSKQKSTVHVQGQKQPRFSSCVVFHRPRTSAPQLCQKHWSCQTLPSMQVPQPRCLRQAMRAVQDLMKLARALFGEGSNCGQSTR